MLESMTTDSRQRLYVEDVAELKGIKPRSVTGQRARGRMPQADGVDVVDGHARPWWSAATIQTWLANPLKRGPRQKPKR